MAVAEQVAASEIRSVVDAHRRSREKLDWGCYTEGGRVERGIWNFLANYFEKDGCGNTCCARDLSRFAMSLRRAQIARRR